MKLKLLVVVGVFLVSFAAIFVKLLNLPPTVIAMYRLGIGGIILLPFALRHEDINQVKLKDVYLLFMVGLIISFHYFFWFTSLQFTSVTSSTLIICTQPLVALAFGYALFKEKVSRNQFILLLVALVGVMIVAWGDIRLSKEALWGDFLTFLAVIAYVIYLIIGQGVVRKFSFIIYTCFLFLSAAFILLIYNLMNGYTLTGYSNYDWVVLLLIALIPNAGQMIFAYVLKYAKSSLIATAILLEPIFATTLAIMILKDDVLPRQIIGGVIILISVYYYIKYDRVQKILS